MKPKSNKRIRRCLKFRGAAVLAQVTGAVAACEHDHKSLSTCACAVDSARCVDVSDHVEHTSEVGTHPFAFVRRSDDGTHLLRPRHGRAFAPKRHVHLCVRRHAHHGGLHNPSIKLFLHACDHVDRKGLSGAFEHVDITERRGFDDGDCPPRAVHDKGNIDGTCRTVHWIIRSPNP